MTNYIREQRFLTLTAIALSTALFFTFLVGPARATYSVSDEPGVSEQGETEETIVNLLKAHRIRRSALRRLVYFHGIKVDSTNQSGNHFTELALRSMYQLPSLTERLIKKMSSLSDQEARLKYLNRERRKITVQLESAYETEIDLDKDRIPRSGSLLFERFVHLLVGEFKVAYLQKPTSPELRRAQERVDRLQVYRNFVNYWIKNPNLEQPK